MYVGTSIVLTYEKRKAKVIKTSEILFFWSSAFYFVYNTLVHENTVAWPWAQRGYMCSLWVMGPD